MDDRRLVVEMIAYIEKNLLQPLTAEKMALQSGYSLNRLRQKFFNVTGDTPSGYLRKRRLTEAAKEILAGEKILDVCLKYGYSSQDNFTTAFRMYFGTPPKELYTIDSKLKKFISKLRETYNIMEIANLKQPPLSSTLMGCIQGAADYFDLDISSPMLYGLSGHAFLINIHQEMCPSGPYVWEHKTFYRLLKELGIQKTNSYHFNKKTSIDTRKKAELEIKNNLDSGGLCILTFLEHQLFSGYDEQGFIFLQPWNGDSGVEVKALTYETWDQCLEKEGWVIFDLLAKTTPANDIMATAKEALQYALELMTNPKSYVMDGYKMGYDAYDLWIKNIKEGRGNTHSHWWNGMVWTECRKFAISFFQELGELCNSVNSKDQCRELAGVYKNIASQLEMAKEIDLEDQKQISCLEAALDFEKQAEKQIKKLVSSME